MQCDEPGCDIEVIDLEALLVHSAVHYEDAFRDAVILEFLDPEFNASDD